MAKSRGGTPISGKAPAKAEKGISTAGRDIQARGQVSAAAKAAGPSAKAGQWAGTSAKVTKAAQRPGAPMTTQGGPGRFAEECC